MSNFYQRKKNGGNDEYFTKYSVAKNSVEILLALLPDKKNVLFIEPSAGDGVFSDILLEKNKKVIAYDINPQGNNIIKKDFLNLDFQRENLKEAIFIGNPPFGTCSNSAIKFFNKASEIANYIAFILPKTFRKISIHKKLNRYFHLIYDKEIPKNSFLVSNREHHVPTTFQIWQKQNSKILFNKIKNDYINWTTKDKAQFVIRRVGGNTGKIYMGDNFLNFSNSSNYFCREKKCGVIDLLNKINFSHIINNTAGVRSLSKEEVISCLQENT